MVNIYIKNLKMLKINNLHAGIEDNEILKGINLEVNAGEVHAIMGPNGSGKSTLAAVIAGKEEYEVTEGNVVLDGEDLEDVAPEERAHKGIFLSFQYPVEIPGVSVTNFIKTAINETRNQSASKAKPISLDTLLPTSSSAVVAMVDFDQVDQAMAELDRFEGGTILHHTLDADVYEKLSAAVED